MGSDDFATRTHVSLRQIFQGGLAPKEVSEVGDLTILSSSTERAIVILEYSIHWINECLNNPGDYTSVVVKQNALRQGVYDLDALVVCQLLQVRCN